MNASKSLVPVLILALVHLVLASFYSAATPYRSAGVLMGQRDPQTGGPQRVVDVGAPDERQHANYIRHLLDGKGFPVLVPGSPDLGETYQSHQPPLFYVIAAGWAKITGADPEQPDSGFRLRFLNSIIGAATVVGVYFLGLWGYRKREVGLVAATFAALLPMFAALSGALSNDPLLFALCTWVLGLCAKGVNDGWNWKLAIWLGVLTGLAFLTKTTAVGLAPILLLAAFLPQAQKPKLGMVVAAAGIAVAIALPWWLRNQSLYGDPLAMGAFKEAFVGSPQAAIFIEGFGPAGYWFDWVGWWTARSFFGAFGYMDIFLNATGTPTNPRDPNVLYRLLTAGMALLVLSWLYSWKKPEWRENKSARLLNLAFLIVVIVLFIQFNLTYFQGQARYLFPAIGPIAIGVAVALLHHKPHAWKIALGGLALVLAGLNGYALSRLPAEFERRKPMAVNQRKTPSLVLAENSGAGSLLLRCIRPSKGDS